MSAYLRVWGIKIYLDDRYTENTSIGLYTPAAPANSEIRLVENNITNFVSEVGETWAYGLLKANSFEPTRESADLRRRGNKSVSGSSRVSIINTDKLNETLENGGIKLLGRKIEIWEFEVDQSDDSITAYVVKSGICGDPSWNDTEYYLPINDSNFKRNAPLGTQIDENNYPNSTTDIRGECVPVTLGELRPDSNGSDEAYTKLIRTSDLINVYENNSSTLLDSSGIYAQTGSDHTGLKEFPVIGYYDDEPGLIIGIKIVYASAFIVWRDGALPIGSGVKSLDYFTGKHIHITEGNCKGARRKIASAEVDLDTDWTIIKITVEKHFEEILAANVTATAENQTWCQIEDINQEYTADVFKCGGFVNSDGAALAAGKEELYSYVAPKLVEIDASGEAETISVGVREREYDFFRLPQYAYQVSDSNANKIGIIANLFESDSVDEMNAFLFVPLSSVKLMDDLNLDQWNTDNNTWTAPGNYYYRKIKEGVYERTTLPVGSVGTYESTNSVSNIIDGDDDTYFQLHLGYAGGGSHSSRCAIAFEFGIPAAPSKFVFDDVFFLLKYKSSCVPGAVGEDFDRALYTIWRRFFGKANQAGDIDFQNAYFPGSYLGGPINYNGIVTIPDFYYGHSTNKDLYFYYSNSDADKNDGIMCGYKNCQIQNISYETWSQLKSIAVIEWFKCGAGYPNEIYLQFYEAVLAFRKKVSIKKELYSPFRGRIYNDTWGSRKTAANLIDNPVDVLEHVLRCQNWSEVGDSEPAGGWGKGYCANAMIDTSTDLGGFDHTSLAGLKTTKCARQILDYDKTYSEKLIKSICGEYFLCQFKKNYATVASGDAGKEMVVNLFDDTAASASITLTDIKPGSIGDMEEPKAEDIYCEPFVRFCYNHARGKFDRIIKISHVSSETWQASYTPGFSGGEGEYFYDLCAALYQQYGTIEPPPEDITDLYWCYDYNTAKQYLSNLIRWMQLKRIPFDVSYETGRTWHIGKKIEINIPRQTGGVAVDAIIEEIEKSKNGDYVRCKYILLDNVSSDTFYLQDTWETVALDWQDTVDSSTEKEKVM